MSIIESISEDLGYIKNEYWDRYFVRTYDGQDPSDPENGIPNWKRMGNDLSHWKSNYFGLFTPHKSFKDFGISLALPFMAPIGLSIAATIIASVSSLAFTIAGFSALLAGGAALVGLISRSQDHSFRDSAFEFAVQAAYVGLIATGISIACGILSWLASPLTTVSLITRSGASIASKCVPGCMPEHDSNMEGVGPSSPFI